MERDIIPEDIEIEIDQLCIICKDESKQTDSHTCQQCIENSWFICKECKDKLHNKPCPVCRNESENIQHSINNRSRLYRVWNKYTYILFPILLTICFFLGKVYIWIFCTQICSPKYYENEENTCSCLVITEYKRDRYWIDTNDIFRPILTGLIVSFLFSICLFYKCRHYYL